MILVVFEVRVKEEGMKDYLALAAGLNAMLAGAEGFIRSERFSSLTAERKLLSLSVWESEEAVEKWRNEAQHRMSQRQGRASLFDGYTLTIASTMRSYTDSDRAEAPADSRELFSAG